VGRVAGRNAAARSSTFVGLFRVGGTSREEAVLDVWKMPAARYPAGMDPEEERELLDRVDRVADDTPKGRLVKQAIEELRAAMAAASDESTSSSDH